MGRVQEKISQLLLLCALKDLVAITQKVDSLWIPYYRFMKFNIFPILKTNQKVLAALWSSQFVVESNILRGTAAVQIDLSQNKMATFVDIDIRLKTTKVDLVNFY